MGRNLYPLVLTYVNNPLMCVKSVLQSYIKLVHTTQGIAWCESLIYLICVQICDKLTLRKADSLHQSIRVWKVDPTMFINRV